jgi:hypothetical protein
LYKIKKLLNTNGIAFIQVRRHYDSLCWPQASKGFSAMKEKIPNILEKRNLIAQGNLS